MDELLQTMESQLNQATNDADKIDCMLQVAWRWQHYDVRRAGSMVNEARQLAHAQSPPYAQGIAMATVVHARLNYIDTKYELAINQSRRALDMLEAVEDDAGKPDALGTIGLAYRRLGIYHEALESHLAEYDAAEKRNSPLKRAAALNNIGLVHTFSEDFSIGKDYLERSLRLFAEHGDMLGEAATLYNLGEGYMRVLNQFEDAMHYFERALDLCTQLPNPLVELVALGSISIAYAELGELDAAEANLNQVLEVSTRRKLSYFRSFALRNRGRVYSLRKDYAAAIRDLHEALALADNIKMAYTKLGCHQMLATVYKAMGDFEQALHHMEAFHHLYEKAHSGESNVKMRNLEILHQTKLAAERATMMELRAKEQERLRLQDRQYFEKLSNIKDEIMDTTSHDLKNPLSVILTSSYLLKHHLDSEDPRLRYVDQIEMSARRMRELVTSLLDLAQIETGRAIAYTTQDITVLLRTVINGFIEQLHAKRQTLHQHLPESPLYAPIDVELIRRALDNLLSNAIKYTSQEGTIEVHLAHEDGQIMLHIVDNGIGISDDALPYIFDRFYRARTQDDVATIEGNGLGLSIVKSIIEQHSGEIHVKSVEGQGSRFTIMLPAASSVPPPSHTDEARTE